jgi:transposase InsO family protein
MGLNGVKHIKTTSYHSSSNGIAERFVQSFKQAMRASENDSGTIVKKLAKFLLAYQNTPHQTTNETPSMLFMGRELKTRLHNIKPDIIAKQEEMCNRRNFHNRNFHIHSC